MMQGGDGPARVPDVRHVGAVDLGAVLRAGWGDFRRAPAFGLLFSAVYVAGGLVLWAVVSAAGREWWLFPLILGFPLLAPFAAIGLYEVSRRIEAGEPLRWGAVLGVVLAHRDRQIPSMAVMILMLFMFWIFIAHMNFALFLGLSPLTNISSSPEVLLSGNGLMMLAFNTVVGALFAATLFCFTVVSLPLLLDHDVDFITAILTSIAVVRENPRVMAAWALVIALCLFAGMAPMFLGLFVALPVLGHASWHMYRRLIG